MKQLLCGLILANVYLVVGASLAPPASSSPSSSLQSKVSLLEFSNFGFTGYYHLVKSLNHPSSKSCTCELDQAPSPFAGYTAPLDEPLSVHFRGPMTLNKFAAYTSHNFVVGQTSSNDTWSRMAFYDASSQSAENVTFLTAAGADSPCLGKALTYAAADGISKAKKRTKLRKDAKLISNQEFSIFSNVSCKSSRLGNDCGVYRKGIPAYHGFSGAVKMFTFEFTMPTETSAPKSVANYDMPAIWLLNAHIPRTSQYSKNPNCSCWRSGCGEFDIFEVKNGSTEVNNLYATIHDYQGTGEIETGLQVPGYIARDTSGTMRGGVAFDSKGKAVVWMSLSTAFDPKILASDVNKWISLAGSGQTKQLLSVSATVSKAGSLAKKNNGALFSAASLTNQIMVTVASVLAWIL